MHFTAFGFNMAGWITVSRQTIRFELKASTLIRRKSVYHVQTAQHLPLRLCSLRLILFFSPEAGPQVSIDAPAQIRPGESAEVRLTVEKGSMTGFARLQVFLPEGLTADGGALQNSQFLHEDNFIKFIWIDLPTDSIFTVSLFLHVAPDAQGTKYLNGFFSIWKKKFPKITFQETAIEISPNAMATTLPKPDVTRRIIAQSRKRFLSR